jgi:hypothetical protein
MSRVWRLFGVLLLSLLVLGSFSLVSANKTQDPWEDWAKEHTVKVLVIEQISYKNGELIREVIYTGDDLRDKLNIGKLSRIEKIKVSGATLEKMYPEGAQALMSGKFIRRIYYKTTILTTPNDPFPWWDYPPYLPIWTWKPVYDPDTLIIIGYERVDPVNLV